MNTVQKAQSEKVYIVGLREHFHAHPELSLKEFQTASRIEQELDALEIPHRRIGETGILATITGRKPGKTLFMRADIDALPVTEANTAAYRSTIPGVMHACGHDGHAASLLGAAKILQQERTSLSGTILLGFQQAEEIGAGAKIFIHEGVLNGVDRVFGLHLASARPVGTIVIRNGESNASCDYFKITVTGKSAHASRPQDSIDALYIASLIVVQLQSIVSRMADPGHSSVVGVGKITSGTSYNIVAGSAVLEGTTRSFSPESRQKVNDAVAVIARQTGSIYGADIQVEFKSFAAPLVNDAAAAAEAVTAAETVFGKENVITDAEKQFGSDDFADLEEKVPGVYVNVGSQGGPDSAWSHHNEHFDIDEQSLVYSAAIYVAYAEHYLGTSADFN